MYKGGAAHRGFSAICLNLILMGWKSWGGGGLRVAGCTCINENVHFFVSGPPRQTLNTEKIFQPPSSQKRNNPSHKPGA